MAAAERAARWPLAATVVALMCVALYAVPLLLADRVDPRVSLLALMALDAACVALLARTALSLWACVALGALVALAAIGRGTGAFALPSVLGFGALALGFGATLRPGAEPLVTAIARGVHGPRTTPALERYTRGLTLAWAAWFAALALGSALLAALASFATWSLVVNLLSWPLILGLCVGEWVFRRACFPELPRSTPAQTMHAALRFGALARPARTDRAGGDAPR